MRKNGKWRSSHCGAEETNPTGNHEVMGSVSGLAQWVKDLALLWLWCRLAAAAPIPPLAWEPPYAKGEALKRQKEKKRKEKKRKEREWEVAMCGKGIPSRGKSLGKGRGRAAWRVHVMRGAGVYDGMSRGEKQRGSSEGEQASRSGNAFWATAEMWLLIPGE